MDEKIKNIVVGIAIAKPTELLISVNGEKHNDYSSFFNDIFFDAIQEKIKHSNWGVKFSQDDEHKPSFVVDIYVDDQNDYLLIREIINSKKEDPELQIMSPYWNFQHFVRETTRQFL